MFCSACASDNPTLASKEIGERGALCQRPICRLIWRPESSTLANGSLENNGAGNLDPQLKAVLLGWRHVPPRGNQAKWSFLVHPLSGIGQISFQPEGSPRHQAGCGGFQASARRCGTVRPFERMNGFQLEQSTREASCLIPPQVADDPARLHRVVHL